MVQEDGGRMRLRKHVKWQRLDNAPRQVRKMLRIAFSLAPSAFPLPPPLGNSSAIMQMPSEPTSSAYIDSNRVLMAFVVVFFASVSNFFPEKVGQASFYPLFWSYLITRPSSTINNASCGHTEHSAKCDCAKYSTSYRSLRVVLL